ncbi:hypothetical protein ACFXPY_41545 [Streptomyces sp. NPDC059153]|uniref:hypothetical protein n=1 Tax=Streptomyces sp. NPDC059153 TaxID=3346743 RepID=UPI0036B3AFB0
MVGQLGKWKFRPVPESAAAVKAVTTLLVEAAVADGGTKVSVHLADQDGQACILALSHRTTPTTGHDDGGSAVLHQITTHQTVTWRGRAGEQRLVTTSGNTERRP